MKRVRIRAGALGGLLGTVLERSGVLVRVKLDDERVGWFHESLLEAVT